jgi:hypothetical protein
MQLKVLTRYRQKYIQDFSLPWRQIVKCRVIHIADIIRPGFED